MKSSVELQERVYDYLQIHCDSIASATSFEAWHLEPESQQMLKLIRVYLSITIRIAQ
jgi:hypothetical protein